MKTPDAAPPPPDACPIAVRPGECLVDGFVQHDPVGTWQATGTTTGSQGGSDYTRTFNQQITIARDGCTASISYARPLAFSGADNSVIAFNCSPGICPRETSLTYVCVRASDGALIYVYNASYTSTMPGNYQYSANTTAVLTPL